MEPFEVMLVNAVLDGLQKIAVDDAGRPGAHAVFPNQNIPSRQQRRGLRADIRENDSGQLLRLVGFLANAVLECAFGRLSRHLQNFSVHVVEPAVITAAQAAVFDVTEFERGAAMGTAQREQTQLPLVVAKDHQVFAEEAAAQRAPLEFPAKSDWMPIASHHFAARRTGPDSGKKFVFLYAKRHFASLNIVGKCAAMIGRYIKEN